MFKKLFTAIAAFFNKLIGRAYEADPVAVFQLKIDQATDKVRKGKENLAKFKGHVNRLQRMEADAERKVALYNNRVNDALTAGKDELAAEADAHLQTVEQELVDARTQLQAMEQQYDQQVRSIKAASDEIVAAKRECESLGLKLKMSEANKEAAELASEFTDTGSSNPLSEISGLRESINSRIDANNAVMDVNTDLGVGFNSERNTEAQFAEIASSSRLAERKAKLGLSAPEPANSEPKSLPDSSNEVNFVQGELVEEDEYVKQSR
jgi:phage shock protein A